MFYYSPRFGIVLRKTAFPLSKKPIEILSFFAYNTTMLHKKEPANKKIGNLTYYGKEQFECPVCKTKFKKEELHQGGGRLIAGDLTDELRRLYVPSERYGEVIPLLYNIAVCPKCFYASFPADFRLPSSTIIEKLYASTQERYNSMEKLFPKLDFNEPRGIYEGTASYYLAIICYQYFDKKFSPTVKQAICSLRLAWLFDTLNEKAPGENYDYLSKLLYHKATFLYRKSLFNEEKGREIMSSAKNLGPDIDKNYGYDGIIYLIALLQYKYGQRKDTEKRQKELKKQKSNLAKMFGLGKTSKEKPGPLLELARKLYDLLKEELKEDD